MCRERVAKVLNMFKNFMQFCFSPFFFRSGSSGAKMSRRNFDEFTMRKFCDTRTNVSRDSIEKTCDKPRLTFEKIHVNLSDI